LRDAEKQAERATELWNRQLIARTDFEAAELAVSTARSDVQSSDAQVGLARAALAQSQVNLGYATISSPIDGIVISRSVDVGQTVAASLSSPTIFTIAADLNELQVNADIDESDIGRIRPKQAVRFEIGTYPGETFTGTVTQVRLEPIAVQNVITYDVIIDTQNPSLKLKPGMTANLHIATAVRDDAWRVPNAALRFRPTAEMFEALGQSPPAATKRRPSTGPAIVTGVDDEGETSADRPMAARNPKATTIDALFGPLVPAERDGEVWVRENGLLKSVRVRVGISDGQMTELIAGDLTPETDIITNILVNGSTVGATPAGSGGLFMNMPGAGGNRQRTVGTGRSG
jgi:HlyD family secretion protein